MSISSSSTKHATQKQKPSNVVYQIRRYVSLARRVSTFRRGERSMLAACSFCTVNFEHFDPADQFRSSFQKYVTMKSSDTWPRCSWTQRWIHTWRNLSSRYFYVQRYHDFFESREQLMPGLLSPQPLGRLVPSGLYDPHFGEKAPIIVEVKLPVPG